MRDVKNGSISVLTTALCKGINSIHQDDVLYDITLKAEDTTVHAHKIVLAAQSSCFKAMFQACSPTQTHTHML